MIKTEIMVVAVSLAVVAEEVGFAEEVVAEAVSAEEEEAQASPWPTTRP